MKPKRFETWLTEAIEAQRAEVDEDPIREVENFVQAGIMTTDRGLVVRFRDGAEIQVTLVLSRRGRSDEKDEDDDA